MPSYRDLKPSPFTFIYETSFFFIPTFFLYQILQRDKVTLKIKDDTGSGWGEEEGDELNNSLSTRPLSNRQTANFTKVTIGQRKL